MEDSKALLAMMKEYPNITMAYDKLDVTDPADITAKLQKVVDKIKYIDILVNGAGIINERSVEKTIAVNLVGLINTTLKALRYMDKTEKGRGGVVVNIASVLGLEAAHGVATYTASKHGVIGFTKSLAHETYFDKTGVIHIAVCPGITKTPLLKKVEGTFEYSTDLANKLNTCKFQTSEEMGENLVKTIEMSRNGGIYICDLGTIREVNLTHYWDFEF